jgi:pyruvate dehydrogenase E2 component (dihydrolipoamide acetyltransferase)
VGEAEDASEAEAEDVEQPAPDGPARVTARGGADAAAGTSAADVADADARRSAPQGAHTGAHAPGLRAHRVKASPLARRMARERGVDLGAVTGSGPGGRIVRSDVAAATEAGAAPRTGARSAAAAGAAPRTGAEPAAGAETAAAGAEAAADAETAARDDERSSQADALESVATAKGETSDVELSRTQQTIARRMAESKATIPDFQLSLDVDMEACVALRAQLKRLSRGGGAAGAQSAEGARTPTYNDMVVKASALALREHPSANGSYRDGRLRLHSRVNVGVAVAARDALVVPTVFDADEKSLGEIARETRALAERVRAGTITPPELGGGTFTVSNLGMYGIASFAAIVNPPQAAILSVGAVAQRAVVADSPQGGTGGAVVARHTMTLTLVSDHRVLYGAQAALFLARIRELLQTPSALTL